MYQRSLSEKILRFQRILEAAEGAEPQPERILQ
jgi:hypothetical protein